jgi:hypothetical protein
MKYINYLVNVFCFEITENKITKNKIMKKSEIKKTCVFYCLNPCFDNTFIKKSFILGIL